MSAVVLIAVPRGPRTCARTGTTRPLESFRSCPRTKCWYSSGFGERESPPPLRRRIVRPAAPNPTVAAVPSAIRRRMRLRRAASAWGLVSSASSEPSMNEVSASRPPFASVLSNRQRLTDPAACAWSEQRVRRRSDCHARLPAVRAKLVSRRATMNLRRDPKPGLMPRAGEARVAAIWRSDGVASRCASRAPAGSARRA